MALRNTAPRTDTLKARFNWVTQAGASVLRNLPFGGAVGVVGSGVILWFLPHLVPEGWSAEAVLSLGMGSGMVMQRLLDGALGWFLEPVKRHLGSRWEAWLRLGKLEAYRKRGMVAGEEVAALTQRIVKDDVLPKQRRR